MRRRAAFAFLFTDAGFTDSKEMTQHELEHLTSVSSLDSPDGHKFWSTCMVVQVLSGWGASVSVWMHGCMCVHHKTEKEKGRCTLKGRRGVEMASGKWRSFLAELKSLSLTPAALEAIARLRDCGQSEWGDFLMTSFQECKASVEMRCIQAWSFWGSLPYSILELASHFVNPNHPETASRSRARDLLETFDNQPGKSEFGFATWNIFGDPTSRGELVSWIEGQPLSNELRDLFIGYGSSLLVMQRLEGRHHLINLSMSRGRAQKPSAIIAGLRRVRNKDLITSTFRGLLSDLPFCLFECFYRFTL
jgi:hypothetical protein